MKSKKNKKGHQGRGSRFRMLRALRGHLVQLAPSEGGSRNSPGNTGFRASHLLLPLCSSDFANHPITGLEREDKLSSGGKHKARKHRAGDLRQKILPLQAD